MSITPGQTLSHYRLVEKIGEGGMGVVWKAEDTVLDRTVAIKVLPADVSRDDARRQLFLQEAKLAGSISDGRIVQIHEFGQEAGLDFIVMELVEGKPLNKLIHGRPLPPEKVAEFGLEAASALSRAHRKGLIHRDLKPANIMVTPDGDVKVLDFGLAVLFERAETTLKPDDVTRTSDGAESTGKGGLTGTISYMSPEQTRGEELDSRTDIFSLGVILYEMATGQRPFTGARPEQILHEIQTARPAPPHERVPKLPLELNRIIEKTLARRRSNRYQSMDDLAVDLKRLGTELESGSSPSYEDLAKTVVPNRRRHVLLAGVAGALAVVVIALGVWWFGFKPSNGLDERTILIFPMYLRGQAGGDEYVGRAFAEAVAIQLTQARGLKVLSVAPNAEATATVLEQAREAGAGRAVIGAILRENGFVRASLNLLDTAENQILWGANEAVSSDELPSLASSLAQAIAKELNASPRKLYDTPWSLTGGSEMSVSRELAETVAALKRSDPQATLNATEQLLRRFPRETAAHALRSDALYRIWVNDSSPENTQRLEESLAVLDSMDPDNPYSKMYRGFIRVEGLGRLDGALEMVSQLLRRDDLTPEMRTWLLYNRGSGASKFGRTEAALQDFEEAIRLNPLNSMTHAVFAASLIRLRRFEEAKLQAEQASLLDPLGTPGQHQLGEALYHLGNVQSAAETLEGLCKTTRRSRSNCALYAASLQRLGRDVEALEYANLAATLGDDELGDYDLARYWVLTGEVDESFRYLRRAAATHLLPPLQEDPDFSPLHGRPEFEAIVAEVKKRIAEK